MEVNTNEYESVDNSCHFACQVNPQVRMVCIPKWWMNSARRLPPKRKMLHFFGSFYRSNISLNGHLSAAGVLHPSERSSKFQHLYLAFLFNPSTLESPFASKSLSSRCTSNIHEINLSSSSLQDSCTFLKSAGLTSKQAIHGLIKFNSESGAQKPFGFPIETVLENEATSPKLPGTKFSNRTFLAKKVLLENFVPRTTKMCPDYGNGSDYGNEDETLWDALLSFPLVKQVWAEPDLGIRTEAIVTSSLPVLVRGISPKSYKNIATNLIRRGNLLAYSIWQARNQLEFQNKGWSPMHANKKFDT
ncbi:hypothetical protein NE237_013462 [Protea cynaroides]|uniref:Uncharacterized protein n=1 Tax=Protea cynaroides TaxID=273540 RepID=A0A9Q0H3Y5_9MAGN|nr:hypothetical protein NE237_013462 [Protea cynaroides]